MIGNISRCNGADTLEDSETITDMNITINEINDRIQEQEDTISSLKAGYDKLFNQHSDLINKLSLAFYNIDESIYNQIFNK